MQALIYNIDPFDAAVGTTVAFSWSGDPYRWIRCIIKDSDFSNVVYTGYSKYNYQNAFKLDPTQYRTALNNGSTYEAYIQVCFNEPESENPLTFSPTAVWSDIQQVGKSFKCFETPTFTFTNIGSDNVISTSSYDFEITYHQTQGIALNSWSVDLYQVTEAGIQKIESTGVNYGIGNASYTNNGTTARLRASFSGFENGKQYKIQATGYSGTLNNLLKFTSDEVNISVEISNKTKSFLKLEAVNRAEFGAIRLNSNIVTAEGYLKYDPAAYYRNTNLPDQPIDYIDLRHNVLTYKEGFEFDNDFTISVNVASVDENEMFLVVSNDPVDPTITIKATYRIDYFSFEEPKAYIDLRVTQGYLVEYYHSNFIDPVTLEDFIQVTIIRGTERHGSGLIGGYDVIVSEAKNAHDSSFTTTYDDLTTYAVDDAGQYVIEDGERVLVSKYGYNDYCKYNYQEVVDNAMEYIKR